MSSLFGLQVFHDGSCTLRIRPMGRVIIAVFALSCRQALAITSGEQ